MTWTYFAIYFHTLQTSQTVFTISIFYNNMDNNIHLLSEEVRVWGFPGLSAQWQQWADGQLWEEGDSAPVRADPGTAHALICNWALKELLHSKGTHPDINNKVTPIILWPQCSLEEQSTWNSSLYYPYFNCDPNKMQKMGNSRNSPFLSLKLHPILSSVNLTVALLSLWQHFKAQVDMLYTAPAL